MQAHRHGFQVSRNVRDGEIVTLSFGFLIRPM
jgi:hypothetical protein